MPTTPSTGSPTDTRDAFARFYDDTAARVYGIVLHVVRDPAQAEHITEQAYLTFWRDLRGARSSQGSGVAGLLALAHAAATDQVPPSGPGACAHTCRTLTSDPAPTPAHTAVLPPDDPSPAGTVVSAVQRRAVELSYFCGHSHTEVAQMLGLSEGSAAELIRSGLLRMRPVARPGARRLADRSSPPAPAHDDKRGPS